MRRTLTTGRSKSLDALRRARTNGDQPSTSDGLMPLTSDQSRGPATTCAFVEVLPVNGGDSRQLWECGSL